ncbi:hypothetical protein PSEWESI4_04888 [Pseudomonas carbonaria]|uniref:Gp5/Type VI secretion system Vgr C-terminal trimerisation domain-containing protein n=1 Tax=Zestomonas carbonaria TaxID=2762745 RepID=A0A7U7ET17_9GAMM|nr:hypothetical protein PSEWESI4_04888 [Pseudomonas carbonaria]
MENDETIAIGNDRSLTVRGQSATEVQGQKKVRVQGSRMTDLLADDSLSVAGKRTVQVGDTLSVGGRRIHLQAGDELIIDGGISLTLQAGGQCIQLDPGGIRSSVPITLGAAPRPIPPIVATRLAATGPLAPTIPEPPALSLPSYVQAAMAGALTIPQTCEFDADGRCKLHLH